MLILCLAVLGFLASSLCVAAPPWDSKLWSVFTGSIRNKLLLVSDGSFDGFCWDYDRDVETPNLDKMARDGVKAAYVTPTFLTITSPAHFTMLSVHYSKGDHGFDNEVMDMKAFFRAVGPDFQKNMMVDLFDLVDVYPLMCHLLEINQEINDGHLENTKHMLVPKKTGGDNNKRNNGMEVLIGFSALIGILVLVLFITTSYNML